MSELEDGFMGVDLLKHNQEAYERVQKAISEGKKKIAISHATGTGKSYLIAKLFEDYNNNKKLVLVPSTYISDQIQVLFEKYYIQNVEVILYQKLIKMSDEDITAMDYRVIALDEYHHDTSKVWGEKVRKLIDTHPESIIFGTSATPIRSDGVNTIDELFERNCASDLPLSESIAKKIVPLPKYVGALYTLDDELEKLRKKVENATNTKEEKQEFYKKINTMRSQIEKSYGMPIILNKNIKEREGKYIIFCKNKKHLVKIKDTVIGWFETAGFKNINAYEVYSDYENKDAEYKAFCDDTNDNLKLLFCVNMLNEGLHLENISGVLLLRPTRSMIVFLQQIGRAIEANNVNTPVIIDAVNNFSAIGQGMELLGEIKEAVAKEKESDPDFDNSGFEDIDTFFVVEQIVEIQEMFREIEGRLQGREWTEEEDNILNKYYGNLSTKEIHNKYLLNRSKASIQKRAKILGITYKENSPIWSNEEIEILEKYYPIEGLKVENRLKGRTKNSILKKVSMRKIKVQDNSWNEEEIRLLKKYYPQYGNKTVDFIPNRPLSSIKDKAGELGIYVEKMIFSESEDKIIEKYYPIEGNNVYKRLNNKSGYQCGQRARKLGISFMNNRWTDKECEILKKYYPQIGSNVAGMLDKSKRSCCAMAIRLGIKYKRKNRYKYVYRDKNKFVVQMYIDGKNMRFGRFDSEEEAAKIAMQKAKEYGKAI